MELEITAFEPRRKQWPEDAIWQAENPMLNFWQAALIGVKHLPVQPLTWGRASCEPPGDLSLE